MKAWLWYIGWGTALSPFIKFIDTYVFSDWQFLKFLFVIIVVDTLLGIFVAVKYKNVSSHGFGRFFTKIIKYGSALIVTHVLTTYTVSGVQNEMFKWVDSIIFATIMIKETLSIFENITMLDPLFFPKGLIKYLSSFHNKINEKIPKA